MDFSKMTDEQVHETLRAARDVKQAADNRIHQCVLELESRANEEYERQQADEARDARNAAIDCDIRRYEQETEFLRTNFTEE